MNNQKDMFAHQLAPLEKELIQVNEGDTVSTIFKMILEKEISSVPVLNKEKRCVGFVDKLDLVSFILHACSGFDLSSFNGQVEASERLKCSTAKDIIGVSFRNPFHSVDRNTCLLDIVRTMISSKLHRIAVVNERGEMENIVTQFQIVKSLFLQLDKFSFASKSVHHLHLGNRSVFTISLSKPAIEAFDMIRRKRVSGIAVVNEEGTLVGNISSSDLKHIGYQGEKMGRLLQSIEMYLQLDRDNIPLYCIAEQDSLAHVIQKMIETDSHRLYIVDDVKIPIGVISLLDILNCFIQNLPQ